MPEPKDQFTASLASEAVEVLEDHLLFPGGYLLPLSARGTGVPGMADRPWSRLSADVFYPNLPVLYSLAMRREPPDVLFTSTEMLNQRLSAARFADLFGIGTRTERRPLFVLIDEAHAYEGTQGAHVAFLLRRWRRAADANCHFVGLSIGGMIGQSLGIRHGRRLRSLMLCDTQTESPADAATRWGPRIEAINKAGSLEPIADAALGTESEPAAVSSEG